jgi:broad specificity phosphatase PhoE
LSGASVLAQSSVFLVRHAERTDDGAPVEVKRGADPDLSAAGKARAESLGTMLRDAGITAIFVTEFARTQQTAAPLARALKITPTIIRADDTKQLIARLKEATGNVLVVGHSNTVVDVMKALGVSTPVTIGDADYDNLFIVNRGTPASLLRLHFR